VVADAVDLVILGQPAVAFADEAEHRIRVARPDPDDHQARQQALLQGQRDEIRVEMAE